MSELRELYQEVILDHTRNPRNKRSIEEADKSAEGFNPLCGDRATIFVKLDGERISDVSFEGRGCSISTASASMMTEALRGKTCAEAETIFESFHELITRAPDAVSPVAEGLGKLAVFAGVSEFPVRVKCASLPWYTFKSALEGKTEAVSSE